MSLSKQILVGLAAGIAAGLFFGEKVSFLEWPAKGFIQLLQLRTPSTRWPTTSRETWAFLVPDHEREIFASLDRVRARPGLRIAVLPVREWVGRLEAVLPAAEMVEVHSILDYVEAPEGDLDAMYTGFERASAYSLIHPRLSAVIPAPGLGSVPVAFAVPEHEEDLLAFVNAWLEEERGSGLIQAKVDYWVRGEGARAERGPRWSIGRDVLGWWR